MGKIIGLGGVFIKAKDPKALADWYDQNLGMGFNGSSYIDMQFIDKDGKSSAGSNVFSFFKMDTSYFDPSVKHFMINLRVEDLDGLLEDLKKKGVEMVGDPLNEDYGKFAWIVDPEGNKIELWEPPAGQK